MLPYDELVRVPGARRVRKGSIIISEGDNAGDNMYLILFGEAGEFKSFGTPDELLTDTYEQGGFFGEFLMFLKKPVRTSIVALSDVILLPLNMTNAPEVFSRFPSLPLEMIGELCKKLDTLSASNEKLVDIIRSNPALGAAIPGMQAASSRKSSLFPEGHGSYTLNLTNYNEEFLYDQKCSCPLCGHNFIALSVITSKLRRESAEGDMRVRYKDIDPLYYEIITCPSCYYSSADDKFAEASKRGAATIKEIINPYRLHIGEIKPGRDKDTFTVFAGYYLAMLCAPVYYDNYQLTTASLWQKLSRIYEDCGDVKMNLYATQKALDDYTYSYGHFNISEKMAQQMCVIIGDLYQKLGKLDDARNFFYLAKSNKSGTAVMTRHADVKLEEIRDIIKAQKEQ